jgi:hypothetical protein
VQPLHKPLHVALLNIARFHLAEHRLDVRAQVVADAFDVRRLATGVGQCGEQHTAELRHDRLIARFGGPERSREQGLP